MLPVGVGIRPVPELEIVPVTGVVEGRTLPVPFERGNVAVLPGASKEDPAGVVKNGTVNEPAPGDAPVGAGWTVLLVKG
ncbi:uncharacterized protein B0T23DRAFT_384872 [Neurospora hispaniola]|uniref:Uncharacterized protein n=1 Tax=Neurospora hispaniola TaxID=588809 RepID=A0AAJ0MPE8_9PEZI|nr:hypothetical protein B0T23DRAFT_384872 [Neurospora hispaniola]